MDIKKYEVLLNAIDHGSFVKACNDLGYTQSGITYLMNSLEKEIGFPLLLRSNRGIQLTREGERVLPMIRELVRLNGRLEQEYQRIQGVKTGNVRVGTFPTIACAWIPTLITEFREKYPDITIELVEENSIYRLEDWLNTGFIDVAFFSKQPKHAYEWIELKKDPYLAVLPDGHPLLGRDAVPVQELMDESFFLCRSLDGIDQDIGRYLTDCGVPILSTLTSNSDFTIVFMIEQGLGTSILPEMMIDLMDRERRRIHTRPLTPAAHRTLGMALRAGGDVSPAAASLIRCAKELFTA